MPNLGLMGMQGFAAQPAMVRPAGLFAPPGFQTGGSGSGAGQQARPFPFKSPEELQELVRAGGKRMDERPGIDSLGEIESLIAPVRDKEWMAVFSPEGKLLSFRAGDIKNVRIPKAVLPIFKGATVVHNHPGETLKPTGFDADLIRKHGAQRMIIVAPGKNGHQRKEWTAREMARLVQEAE